MMLAMHEMDHILEDILNCGPPPALWEFVTECSMGEVTHSVTSQQFPFFQLARTLIEWEQLKVLQMRYHGMSESLNYSDTTCDWNTTSCTEKIFPAVGAWYRP